MQRGARSEVETAATLALPETAGEKKQPNSADGEADAALRMELASMKAVLDDERQVLCSCSAFNNMPYSAI